MKQITLFVVFLLCVAVMNCGTVVVQTVPRVLVPDPIIYDGNLESRGSLAKIINICNHKTTGKMGVATGFTVHESGIIATAAHVAKHCDEFLVLLPVVMGHKIFLAKVVEINTSMDRAFLKIVSETVMTENAFSFLEKGELPKELIDKNVEFEMIDGNSMYTIMASQVISEKRVQFDIITHPLPEFWTFPPAPVASERKHLLPGTKVFLEGHPQANYTVIEGVVADLELFYSITQKKPSLIERLIQPLFFPQWVQNHDIFDEIAIKRGGILIRVTLPWIIFLGLSGGPVIHNNEVVGMAVSVSAINSRESLILATPLP